MAKVKIADNSNETKRTQDETEANIDARLIEFLQQTEGLMKTSNEEKSRIVTQEPEATTIAEVFEQALREVPARGTAAKNLNLSNVVQEGDPYEKKTIGKSHENDLCTLCLHGRVWELVLDKILDKDCTQKDEVLQKLVATHGSKLCNADDAKSYYEELKKNRPNKSQGGKKGETANVGGALNDVVVMYQNASRPIRFILYNNRHFKYFTFNKRKGIIKHLLTELPASELEEVWNYASHKGARMMLREVSETQTMSCGCETTANTFC